MNDLTNLLKDTVASGLKRQAITVCSKWAKAYRVMPPPFPGIWTPGPAPWTLDMHDSIAPVNIGQKSAQMGYTETILNITFFNMDINSLNCLYVLPTKMPDASEFSASRFDIALELSPHLTNLFSNVKNVGHKRAGAASLYIRGSNSRSALKSIPVALLLFDEVDEMNQENIPLAEERTSGQLAPIIWKISTPTIPNVRINEAFLLSTQEHYVFKCPSCSRFTELIWPDSIIITAESMSDPKLKNTYLICKECNKRLPAATGIQESIKAKQSWLNVDNARWESFGDPQVDARGFYINQLYSMVRQPWEIAYSYLRGLINKVSEQEFFNSKLGLPHIVEGAQVKDFEIEQAIGSRRKEDKAPEGILVTMGVDQGKWLHYEIAAWRFPKLGNDLNMVAECEVLTEGKCIDFEELEPLMAQWQVMQCVIDAQPDRRMAYEFAVRFWGHVKLCFYARGQSSKTISIDPDEDQHKISVDRTSWLDAALNRFRTKTITLPQNISVEYREQIKNLVRHYRKDHNNNPVSEYVAVGADHFGHARCYAEIALPLAASFVTNKDIKVFL